MHALQIVAGDRALERIRHRHFRVEDIAAMMGASGGPKWFVLSQLDRYLAQHVLPHAHQPVHLVGSSIGAWRMAAHASPDPAATLQRLETEYLNQRFGPKATSAEITAQCQQMLRHVFPEPPRLPENRPLHIVTARCKGVTTATGTWRQAAAFGLVATSNLLSSRLLNRHFERHLVESRPGTLPVRDYGWFHTTTSQLDGNNWQAALMATAAIPLVLDPVASINGSQPGCYRDGGMVDYHFNLPFETPDGLILYPHFTPDLKPGWFDKALRWRHIDPDNYQDIVMLLPTSEFIGSLPHGKIPDRRDFRKLSDHDREHYWRKSVQAGERLADEFHDWISGGGQVSQVRSIRQLIG